MNFSAHIDRLKVWLAWWSVWFMGYHPEKGADYTRRCQGCGYYAGETRAGDDHYGWSCGVTRIPWWEPIRAKTTGMWQRLRDGARLKVRRIRLRLAVAELRVAGEQHRQAENVAQLYKQRVDLLQQKVDLLEAAMRKWE